MAEAEINGEMCPQLLVFPLAKLRECLLAVELLMVFVTPQHLQVISDLSSLQTVGLLVFGLALSKDEGNQHVAMVCSAAHPKVSSRLCGGCCPYPRSTEV